MSKTTNNITIPTTPCIVLTLSVPLTSLTNDGKQVRAAYAELRSKLAELATAIAAEPNSIINHTQLLTKTPTPTQLEAVSNGTANAKIASLQGISSRIEKGESPAVTPGYVSRFDPPEDTQEENPHIVAHDIAEYKKACEAESSGPVVDEAGEKLHKVIFDDMIRKTSKSLAIMKYLIEHRDKPVTISDIATSAELSNGDVSIWLSTTGQNVKGLTDAGKRGTYIFNTSKIKI